MAKHLSLLTLIGALAPNLAFAETVQVRADGSGDYTSLADALAGEPAGDPLEIVLGHGSWGALTVTTDRPLTVRGESAAQTRLTTLTINHPSADVRVSDVAFTGASTAVWVQAGSLQLDSVGAEGTDGMVAGSALVVQSGGTLHANNLRVDRWASDNGGLYIATGGTVGLTGAGFHNCTATTGAGIHVDGGTLTASDVIVRGAQATEGGAGIAVSGGNAVFNTLEVTDSTAARGAGIYVADGVLAARDVELQDNVATWGGNMAIDDGTVVITRGIFDGGEAMLGGAVHIRGGINRFENTLFRRNVADGSGGVMQVEGGATTVLFANFHENTATAGGGIAVGAGDVAVGGSIFTFIDGHAIANSGSGTVTMEDSFLWGIMATPAVYGDVDYQINGSLQNPMIRGAMAGDFALLSGSPALDTVPGLDLDGTAADAGMYGGLQAWARPDADGDGFVDGRDCDDSNPAVNEAADERLYDGIDQDCDRQSDYDQDGDGFDAAEFGGTDCDDTDNTVFPGAEEEAVDKRDQDCDGQDAPDRDNDGWVSTLDCDDEDASVNPDAREDWYDGVDQNCTGGSDFDRDQDGAEALGYGGTDCDDNNAAIHPLATEIAGDGTDQNCDGEDSGPVQADAGGATTSEEIHASPAPQAAAEAPAKPGQMVATGCSVAATATGVIPMLLGLLGIARRRE